MVTLATDLAAALDPVAFAERATGYTLDDWQRRALRSPAARQLWLTARQVGKTETAALLAVWTLLYVPRSLTLLVSPSLRQSLLGFRRCLDLYRALDGAPPPDAETALKLEVRGAQLLALPGNEKTVRGHGGVTLLVVDEAARIDDDLWMATAPMVGVSGGRIVLLSSPFGRRGVLWQFWSEGGPTWERTEIRADQCPRLSPAFIAEMERSLPAWQFRQELLCSWEDSELNVFSSTDIEAALVEGAPLWAP
jgi:hypothetical protein